MQSDLEKSLNESVEKVLPSQDTEVENRERQEKITALSVEFS